MAGSWLHIGTDAVLNRPPHRILLAPVSFKGSLTAAEAAAAMEQGVRRVLPDAAITRHPVSDGGEGLIDVLMPALGGRIRTARVQGPLPGQRVTARWGMTADGTRAVIEMAEAAGLALIPPELRDPRITTTFGVGELIRAAMGEGAVEILIGIGGSATNDGGAGMAAALGAVFLDSSGTPLAAGGAALAALASIERRNLDIRLDRVHVTVACDVSSPMTGPAGASRVYGPQKGAGPVTAEFLDAALHHYAAVLRRDLGCEVENISGGGAAGGLGAGLVAFCHAALLPGIDVVLDATGFEAELRGTDLVLTGEGRLDAQTRSGKALEGILRRSRHAGIPVAAVVGSAEGPLSAFTGPDGFAAVITLVNAETPAAQAMLDAATVVTGRTAELLSHFAGR